MIYIQRNNGPGGSSWLLFVPGALLLAAGILILIFPEILIIAISALFIVAGVTVLGWAYKIFRASDRPGPGF